MSLARGIQADRAAVVNGLTLPWSTGPVEGTVTKVKLLKRQGYEPRRTSLNERRRRAQRCCGATRAPANSHAVNN